jgi:hypothetical protein
MVMVVMMVMVVIVIMAVIVVMIMPKPESEPAAVVAIVGATSEIIVLGGLNGPERIGLGQLQTGACARGAVSVGGHGLTGRGDAQGESHADAIGQQSNRRRDVRLARHCLGLRPAVATEALPLPDRKTPPAGDCSNS